MVKVIQKFCTLILHQTLTFPYFSSWSTAWSAIVCFIFYCETFLWISIIRVELDEDNFRCAIHIFGAASNVFNCLMWWSNWIWICFSHKIATFSHLLISSSICKLHIAKYYVNGQCDDHIDNRYVLGHVPIAMIYQNYIHLRISSTVWTNLVCVLIKAIIYGDSIHTPPIVIFLKMKMS